MIQQVTIAVRRTNGTVSLMAFLIVGRGHILPFGAQWISERAGWWTRPANPENVARDLAVVCELERVGYVDWRVIKKGEVPEDRTYRDAWEDDGKAVTINIEKAKEIQRNRIRGERIAALQELDGEWMKAFGQGDTAEAARIEAERQQWRDAPADPSIEAAQTVEELQLIKAG